MTVALAVLPVPVAESAILVPIRLTSERHEFHLILEPVKSQVQIMSSGVLAHSLCCLVRRANVKYRALLRLKKVDFQKEKNGRVVIPTHLVCC